MKLTDKEIKNMAEAAGFSGFDIWWEYYLPAFRKLIEMANNPVEQTIIDKQFELRCVRCKAKKGTCYCWG